VSEARLRLWQILDLVAREDDHLAAVRDRLCPADAAPPSTAELALLLTTPLGVDRLESFVGKFSRMQDTMMDKLLPALLRAAGEPVGSAIDNLNRLAALGLLDDPDHWLAARALRNRLVHEYVQDLAQLADALAAARAQVDLLRSTHQRIRAYCEARAGLRRASTADRG
jgi:hypothetical protein